MGDLGVDVVVESTGYFTKAEVPRNTGRGREEGVISAPATGEDLTVVMGVNDDVYDGSQTILSNASCTTNCLAPMAKVLTKLRHRQGSDDHHPRLHQRPGRSWTSRTRTCGGPGRRPSTSSHLHRRRQGRGAVLPELKGKLHGFALRVPVLDGSVTDLTVELSHAT